jgi:hypothetical protein
VSNRDLKEFKARVYSIYAGTVVPWTTSLRDGIELCERASEAALPLAIPDMQSGAKIG